VPTDDLFEWADASARAAQDIARRLVPESEVQRRFEAFHAENPRVYERLVAMARELRARGRERVGIGMLFEVLRWEHAISTTGDDFRLNNNFRSRYVRLIERREPDLRGLFETRELRA